MYSLKFLVLSLFMCSLSHSQILQKPSNSEVSRLPLWAQKMYSENPSVFEVDSLYRNYYKSNTFEKNYHTQYYKRWKKSSMDKIDSSGRIKVHSLQELEQIKQNYLQKQSIAKTSEWSVVGPLFSQPGKSRVNVYCIDQCLSDPNVLYIGTEPGEVYKSIDGGENWSNSSMNYDLSGVSAIEVNYNNPSIVFTGGERSIFKSIDGGQTWTNVLTSLNLNVNEILISSGNDQLVFAATQNGLYRSTDGGNTWVILNSDRTYDIKQNTASDSIFYILKNNLSENICEFFKSTDFGQTWTIQNNGWFSSSDTNRIDGGGRLAVTAADPNRVYAYLIGESKLDDFGFIGVYRSDDGGQNWILPNGPAGSPYTSTHLNLAVGDSGWTYHQGYYNCAIMASSTNPNEILVGGLSLYKSTDAGSTFFPIAGYAGGPLDIHVDMQDFRVIGNTTWITTDGGVCRSTDFFTVDNDFLMNGVHGADFWGFGSGWNEDVLVGGLYHNGNTSHHENYGPGVFLELGGGEAPTGYVYPGNNRKTCFSDINGRYLPLNLNDPIVEFNVSMFPNESYFASNSSEMEFHPNCYSIAYIGKENKLWKTEDGGESYALVSSFGSSADASIGQIEISSSNPNVIYLVQNSGSEGLLWKTTDGGLTWESISIPSGYNSNMCISINPMNEQELWMSYLYGSNGNKIYKTSDGGLQWENLTTSLLDNEGIHSISHIAGTNGGVYIGTNNAVYYRNNSNTWTIENSGLPLFTNTNSIRPFYRDGKLRLASYGKGIWETTLTEQPLNPICRIMVDKLSQSVICGTIDTFYFDDYSFLNHHNATWEWSFPTGMPSTSSMRNPAVYFPTTGSHVAILKITDQNGNSDSDTLVVNVENYIYPSVINEDFETIFLPNDWFKSENGYWSQSNQAGGFGNSNKSAYYSNFYIDGIEFDDMYTFVDLTNLNSSFLTFDVAYAKYNDQNSDSLEVLISLDCGATYTNVYTKGGDVLSTAPSTNNEFTPTANEWRKETIDLSAFIGNAEVQVVFRNVGHYGNNLYVDNINLNAPLNVEENSHLENVHVYPNPVCTNSNLYIEGLSKGANIKLVDMKGKTILNQKTNSNSILIPSGIGSGTYLLNIKTDNKIWNKKIIINN